MGPLVLKLLYAIVTQLHALCALSVTQLHALCVLSVTQLHALCVLSITQLHACVLSITQLPACVFETDTHISAMQTQCTLCHFSVDVNEE